MESCPEGKERIRWYAASVWTEDRGAEKQEGVGEGRDAAAPLGVGVADATVGVDSRRTSRNRAQFRWKERHEAAASFSRRKLEASSVCPFVRAASEPAPPPESSRRLRATCRRAAPRRDAPPLNLSLAVARSRLFDRWLTGRHVRGGSTTTSSDPCESRGGRARMPVLSVYERRPDATG